MAFTSFMQMKLSVWSKLTIIISILFLAFGAVLITSKADRGDVSPEADLKKQAGREDGKFYPTSAQWTTLTVEPVTRQVFRSEHVTEGKIAVDEDRSAPVFSPYSGHIIKLLAKPGDTVTAGQPLFTIDATDMVQAQSDFIAGIATKNKAISQRSFAEIDERRFRTLSRDKAIPQRDFEQAQTAPGQIEPSLPIGLQRHLARVRIVGEAAPLDDAGR